MARTVHLSPASGLATILLHVARTHPLARRSQVDLAALAKEHFIASPPPYQLRQRLDSWCARAGFTPHVAFEISGFETIRVLVGHGLGIAPLPAAETPHPDLVAITLSGWVTGPSGSSRAATDRPPR
ncbi:LysR family transcriptional regulator substrate-binding protein [Rhodococcus sp. MTM3W5.2]|uniref:LysR family transcriptional regulator substrate-binding protein n=1 Tax=Rhodococcus sp. MTM3W5.2 TaxID=1805827 RepID=UPI001677236D|nr:LysR family transcriptional regulator substrate-binding protein [Rhodococcus sp. MTM3W5.2]